MTFVLDVRDRKKSLLRPVIHFWQRAGELLYVLRKHLALLGVLGFALDYPFAPKAAPIGSVLPLLCGVLSAAVSATLALLCNASIGLYSLFSDDASPLFRIGQRFNLCLGEPAFTSDICPEAGPFPAFSGHCALALVACALFLFGGGVSRKQPAEHGRTR
jgi:hypothetical protein